MALKLWGEECKQRFIVSFINNEASRAALIKAWSDSIHANNILRLYVDDEMLHGWKPWFGRVPSHSNPADDPSRLIIDKLLKAGVIHDIFDWNSILSKLVDAAHVGELGWMRVCYIRYCWWGRWPTNDGKWTFGLSPLSSYWQIRKKEKSPHLWNPFFVSCFQWCRMSKPTVALSCAVMSLDCV